MFQKIKNNLNREGLRKVPFFLASNFSRKGFKFIEKYLKLHVTPVHFYSPIPTLAELDTTIFEKIYDCTGIDWNIDEQMSNLNLFYSRYYREYTPVVNIDRISQMDSFVLYSIIRDRKPKTVVEIGSGESTKISLSSLERNEKEGNAFTFYAIDPYPPEFLKDTAHPHLTFLDKKVQEVDIELLSSADLLFIDSSHVSRIGSDVNYEILEIIPKLKIGTVIHWHDIMIPTNYLKQWICDRNMFWNESYMLHAFMLFNSSFKVIWASRYLQINYSDELRKRFSYFNPEDDNQQMTSFWVERTS